MTTPRSTVTATPAPNARTGRTRPGAVLGLGARLLGFAAILASLAFAAWGWCHTLLH